MFTIPVLPIVYSLYSLRTRWREFCVLIGQAPSILPALFSKKLFSLNIESFIAQPSLRYQMKL